jgi:hypothetical protein
MTAAAVQDFKLRREGDEVLDTTVIQILEFSKPRADDEDSVTAARYAVNRFGA